MNPTLLFPSGHRLKIIAAVALLGLASLCAQAQQRAGAAAVPRIHPQVFSLIECRISDVENPSENS